MSAAFGDSFQGEAPAAAGGAAARPPGVPEPGWLGGRWTDTEAETGRPLLTPDEIRRLPEDEALVFVAGARRSGARVPYWRDRELARRAGWRRRRGRRGDCCSRRDNGRSAGLSA
jgi:hypothetical protein